MTKYFINDQEVSYEEFKKSFPTDLDLIKSYKIITSVDDYGVDREFRLKF